MFYSKKLIIIWLITYIEWLIYIEKIISSLFNVFDININV